jgi:hypothetical protein
MWVIQEYLILQEFLDLIALRILGGRYHLSWLSPFPVKSCYKGLILWLIVTTTDIKTCQYQLIYLWLPTLHEAIWTKFKLGNLFITYKTYFLTAYISSPAYVFILVLLLLLHFNFVKNRRTDIHILLMANVLDIIPGFSFIAMFIIADLQTKFHTCLLPTNQMLKKIFTYLPAYYFIFCDN